MKKRRGGHVDMAPPRWKTRHDLRGLAQARTRSSADNNAHVATDRDEGRASTDQLLWAHVDTRLHPHANETFPNRRAV